VVLHTRVVTGAGGGPDKTILLSATFLSDTNYWLAAAYMHPPGDTGFESLRHRAAAAGCPLVGVPDRGPFDLRVFHALLALCRHLGVRIWHSHDYKTNLLGVLLRRFHSMKLVTTAHGWVKRTARTPVYHAFERWSLRRYDHVICVSDDLVDQVRSLGVAQARCTLLPNAVDETMFNRRYPAAESRLRARQGVPTNRLIVGAVGRLSPEKGLDKLVIASAALLARGLDFELWIVGEGEARAHLQELIARRGLQERVKLWGFWYDMVELYHAMDVFVLSSSREALPNVVLEAMAMEVPVVSTAVAGVPRLIADGRTGVLCRVGDVDALATALERALLDGALRVRMAHAARARIEREYSFTRRMARERTIYDQMLGTFGAGQ
jgi:glycosyltransferase involved in cell wall biosynthesis